MGDGHQSATTSADTTRELRIMRALDEYTQRRDAGDFVPQDEFLAAHPDLAPDLAEHLSLIEHFSPGPDQLEHLIARGLLRRTVEPGYAAALGPYLVERIIGRGGMGVVLKAYDAELGRDVALKVLQPERVHDPTALLRFQREARAAAGLRHPNIVTVYTVGRDVAAHYIAMEYVAGPSLAELIGRHGPLPAATVREVFRQLLAALAVAHKAGLVHRDVKSSNILLEMPSDAVSSRSLDPSIPRSLTVKLADFGLARVLASSTQLTLTRAILGTPEYMSPEQARGEEVDHRTDFYSAGVVLYEMLTGRTPFKADTPTATLQRILNDEPRDPRRLGQSVDPALATLALCLMAKRREDRLALATEALRALNRQQQVHLPRGALRLRPRSRAAVALVLLGVATVAWVYRAPTGSPASSRNAPPGRITRIETLTDRTGVRAYYGDAGVPKRLRWLEAVGYRGRYPAGAQGCATTSDDRQIVLLGCESALDPNGCTLIAFDPSGRELWRINPDPGWAWPRAQPTSCWIPSHVKAADLDGRPGDEFLVVAHHPDEYPSRISIVDAETGAVRSTLWHVGQPAGVLIVDNFNFLSDHRPAIVVWGEHNKLPGFSDGQRGARRQLTQRDVVGCAMVLHPDRMDGLAPPPIDSRRLAELGWPSIAPAQLWAYAFLDQPDTFALRISKISTRTSLPGAALRIETCVDGAEENRVHEAALHVDRCLRLVDIGARPPGAAGKLGTNREFWHERWQVVMQEGRRVNE